MEGKVFFNHLKNEKEEMVHRTNVKYFFFSYFILPAQ